jgi:L-asparaginase
MRDLAGIAADEVRVVDLRLVRGSRLDTTDLDALLGTVSRLVRDDGLAGVVVTTGSVTLEELASLLATCVPAVKPIVVTGATRNADEPEWDGGRNLRTAMAVAGARELASAGTVVAFADEVHSALVVRKAPRGDTVGFESPGLGPIATVESGAVVVHRRLAPIPALGVDRLSRAAVPIWTVGVADAAGALRHAVAGAEGLVLVGFPHLEIGLPAAVLGAARDLMERGVPVVYTSRFGALSREAVAREEPRFLVTAALAPAKARLALMATPPTAEGTGRLRSLLDRIDRVVEEAAMQGDTRFEPTEVMP